MPATSTLANSTFAINFTFSPRFNVLIAEPGPLKKRRFFQGASRFSLGERTSSAVFHVFLHFDAASARFKQLS